MANVFGILTAVVLALSAYIALKNKAAYETSIEKKQTAVDELAKNEGILKAVEAKVKELPDQIATAESEVEKLTSEEQAQTKINTDLEGQAAPKAEKIAANKAKLDEIREKTPGASNINELASTIRTKNAENEELGQSIAAVEAKLANLTSQNTSAEAQVNASKTKFEGFANGQSAVELKTRIRSIYPNWGFVTLASGNNAGVVANSTLDVVRGGETVAKLLVTAVESNTASASIIPDSLASDVTLSVGDRVVPGTKVAKNGN